MRILIVEPSPLARNVFGIILRQMTECTVTEAVDTESIAIGQTGAPNPYDLIILGGRAFEENGGKLRALLTDVPSLGRVPKIVIALESSNGKKPQWNGLKQTVVVKRPFSPAELEKTIRSLVKKES